MSLVFHSPEIRAHRGCLNGQPEFALSSLANVCRGGANMVELDARLTSDGVAVVNHDVDIERTTNGTGNVADLTFAQLRSYVIDQFGTTTEKVPTLAECLDVLKGYPVRVLIEPKVAMAAKIAAAVAETGFPLERLMLAVFAGDTVAQFRAQKSFEGVPIMGVASGTPTSNGGAAWIASSKALGFHGAWFWPATFTIDDAKVCAENDYWFSYDVTASTVVGALAWGVPNVSTDYVGECVAAVQASQWDGIISKYALPGGGHLTTHDADADGRTNLGEILLGLNPVSADFIARIGQDLTVNYAGTGRNRTAFLRGSFLPQVAPVWAWYPQWSDDGVNWTNVPWTHARLDAGGYPRDRAWRWQVRLDSSTKQARLAPRAFPLS